MITENDRITDDFLKALLEYGIRCRDDVCLTGGSVTEDGLLGFAFGAANADNRQRTLAVEDARISKKFLKKLVEVSRNGYHSIEMSNSLLNLDFSRLSK